MLGQKEGHAIIGDMVTSKRLEMKLSPDELSERLGITKAHLADMEFGEIWPYEYSRLADELENFLGLNKGSVGQILLKSQFPRR